MSLVQQFDIDLSVALSTLGAGVAIAADTKIDASRENGFRLVKSDVHMTMSGKTTAEGPLVVGLAGNFASLQEVTDVLDNDPQSRNADMKRGKGTFLKILGTIGLVPTTIPSSDTGVGIHFEISYGKNGWSIPEGQKVFFWVRNNDSSALTTGTVVQFTAEHFGVWLND